MGNSNRNGSGEPRIVRRTRALSLILHCVSLAEKGAGSAWGLPLIRDGKNRYSALAVSQALKGKAGTRDGFAEAEFSGGAELPDGNFFGREELAELGIGPLGRYPGGEPIKPLPLKPEHFFLAGFFPASTARNFFSGLEFEKDTWHTGGNFSSLFHFHLEFLRAWGFSGGLVVPDERSGGSFVPLAEYLRFLHNECRETGGKILAAMDRTFFEKKLLPLLPETAPFVPEGTGKIPLNNAEGGESLLAAGISGAGIVLYEALPPDVKNRNARCDILLVVETGQSDPSAFALIKEIEARLVLGIAITDNDASAFKNSLLKQTGLLKPGGETESRLIRSLVPASPGGKPPPLKFSRPAPNKTGPSGVSGPDGNARLSPGRLSALLRLSGGRPNRDEAAALGLLPQWEAGRVQAAGGAVFAVNAKFAGIRAADFRDEQALYYGDPKQEPAFAAPPESGEAAFEKLDKKQRVFFLYWRDQCRRGNYILPEPAVPGRGAEFRHGLEYYIEVYARELILLMGNEGPMKGFLALRELFHEYGETFPALGNLLFRFLVDFAVIYGIVGEAFGFLFDRLPAVIERQRAAGKIDPAVRILLDIALFRFFVEEKRNLEDGEGRTELLPFVKALLPRKVRKSLDGTGAEEKFGGALVLLDRRLREDWGMGLFEFFCPPSLLRADFKAFEKCPAAGSSSYTVCRFDFSDHPPLASALESLALNPDSAAAGLPIGERPLSFSLETDILEELRRESNEVRELLTTDGLAKGPSETPPPKAAPFRPSALLNEKTPRYTAPDPALMKQFIRSLSGADQNAVALLLDGGEIGEEEAERINVEFNSRFGDLLIVYEGGRPSIPDEYLSILKE
jgi:hypothetical protein